jgi:hypothetical protein
LLSPTRVKPSSLSATSKLPPAELSPRTGCNSSFAALAENEDCRVSLRPLGYGLTSRSPAERDEGGLRAPGISAANYLSRQSGTTADDSASHYGVFLRLYSPNRVETARFTVTPKDFAPTRFKRDQSGVAIQSFSKNLSL